jgi:hypothetical protein
LIDILKHYKTAGIELFQHLHYESYKCLGPYESKWGEHVASWHPSILGHELRASHHVFFWLLILKDAILDINRSMATARAALSDAKSMHMDEETANKFLLEHFYEVSKHIENEHRYIPSSPLYESVISDEMQCYTNFEPRSEAGSDLSSRIVSGNVMR